MKEQTLKRIAVSANLAILVTAPLFCVVLIKNYLISKPVAADITATRINNSAIRRPANTQIQPGAKLSLTGIDWAKNGQTLLLAVSDKCRYCTESGAFYQRLAHERGETQLVVVLPQTVEDGKKYLESLRVAVDDVRQVSLASFGVRSTPTLILVDRNGIVKDSWVGRLSADRELEVLSSLEQSVAARN